MVTKLMNPKSISRWQQLKQKKRNNRSVAEEMEYQKLQMKHNADVLTLHELQWKAELAEAIMTSAINNANNQRSLNSIIDTVIGDKSKPYSRQSIHDFVNSFIDKRKQELAKQNHEKKPSDNQQAVPQNDVESDGKNHQQFNH